MHAELLLHFSLFWEKSSADEVKAANFSVLYCSYTTHTVGKSQ